MIKKKLLTVGVILVSQSALLHAELSESSPNIICILACLLYTSDAADE